ARARVKHGARRGFIHEHDPEKWAPVFGQDHARTKQHDPEKWAPVFGQDHAPAKIEHELKRETRRQQDWKKQMPVSNQPRRTLLLTGASRGIGHATVKRFSAAGWRVLTCSRHPFPENCPWEAGPEDHVQVDLADPDNTDAAIAEIKERLNGELHALVNNAAISPKGAGGKRLGSIDTAREDWHRVFQVNFFAPIMLARGLLDELK